MTPTLLALNHFSLAALGLAGSLSLLATIGATIARRRLNDVLNTETTSPPAEDVQSAGPDDTRTVVWTR